jgi:Flp pilus assembly protein TadD
MLGSFQYAAGEFQKALMSFEQLLALADEADPEVCLKLGLVYITQGLYDKAYDLLMFTVQRREISVAWTALGVCCLRLGDFEEAEVALSQANEMDRWDATTWGYCAVMCARLGRWIEGEQAVTLAATLELRDFRLISEILEFYGEVAKEEDTKLALQELRKIEQGDCHASLEAAKAGKGNGEEEEGGAGREEED